MRTVFRESGCLGVQPKWGGIRHPRLNISERPIANKYCEGKLKSTLERESNEHVKLLAGKRWAAQRTPEEQVFGIGLRVHVMHVHEVLVSSTACLWCGSAWVAHTAQRPHAIHLVECVRHGAWVRPRNTGRPQGNAQSWLVGACMATACWCYGCRHYSWLAACVLQMLAEWRPSTRLGTRTKESRTRASVWVTSPDA